MHDTLQLTLILLAAAVLVVVVCRQLKLPPLLGYLLVGIAIGPKAIGWVPAHKFEQGIRETIRWYLDNQPWVQTVLKK